MKKRFFAVVIAGLMAMSVVGCGNNGDSAGEGEKPENRIRIRFEYDVSNTMEEYREFSQRTTTIEIYDKSGDVLATGRYHTKTEENAALIQCHDEQYSREMAFSRFDETYPDVLKEWEAGEYPSFDVTEEFPDTLSFEVDGVTIDVNVEKTRFYVGEAHYDVGYEQNYVIDYVYVTEDGEKLVACAYDIAFEVIGTYTCDGDIMNLTEQGSATREEIIADKNSGRYEGMRVSAGSNYSLEVSDEGFENIAYVGSNTDAVKCFAFQKNGWGYEEAWKSYSFRISCDGMFFTSRI